MEHEIMTANRRLVIIADPHVKNRNSELLSEGAKLE